jgi:uncharacterized Zn finger protein (UPF0148 family)
MSIGIPYAHIDLRTGERICPVCGERIAEEHDASGEEVTQNYAHRYAQSHGAQEER